MDVFWINTNTHYKIWRDFLIIWPQEHIYPKLENHGFQNMWNFDQRGVKKQVKSLKMEMLLDLFLLVLWKHHIQFNLHVEYLAFSIECVPKKLFYVCTTQMNLTKNYH